MSFLLCRHRLTVRTPDSQSGNRGSIPRGGISSKLVLVVLEKYL